MFGRIAASSSQSLLAVLAAFVAGVAAHAAAEFPWAATAFASCAAVAVVIAFVARRFSAARLAALVLSAALAGVARYDVALASLPAPVALDGSERRFVGTLVGEPRHGVDGTVLLMDRVFVSDDGRASPVGAKMEVRTRLPVSAAPGDRFRWSCRPSPLEGARSEAAVFLRGIGWRCRPRSVPERVGEGRGVTRFFATMKGKMRDTLGRLVSEPAASLLLGLLVGDRDGLPRDVADAFRRTGTAHVLAVSGYNVSRLVGAFVILFALVGVARRRASALVGVVIIAFAAFVGAEASVVRAAVMGCAGILATALGRRYHGANAFMLAAASMLAFQPLLLRHDAGFRLSFAAVAGLHAFGPPLVRRLTFLPEFAGIRSSCAETLGATLMTLPIILRDFGILPVFGPVTNVVIAPLVPLAMAAGFVTLVVSAVPIALAPAFAATAFLRALVAVVTTSARFFPVIEARVGAATMTLLYAWIFLLWFALNRLDALCEERA